jgi:hypothetical protein
VYCNLYLLLTLTTANSACEISDAILRVQTETGRTGSVVAGYDPHAQWAELQELKNAVARLVNNDK